MAYFALFIEDGRDFVASKVNQKNLMNFEWINKIRPKAF